MGKISKFTGLRVCQVAREHRIAVVMKWYGVRVGFTWIAISGNYDRTVRFLVRSNRRVMECEISESASVDESLRFLRGFVVGFFRGRRQNVA